MMIKQSNALNSFAEGLYDHGAGAIGRGIGSAVRGAGSVGKEVLNQASYFIPGVSTARYGIDAANAFSKGKWLSGIGNTAAAGISLIPGIGGGLAKSLGAGVNAIGLGAKFTGLSKLAPGVASRAGKLIGSGIGRVQKLEDLGQRAVSGIGRVTPTVTGALTRSKPVQWAMQHPETAGTIAGTSGISSAAGMAGINLGLKPAAEGLQESMDMAKRTGAEQGSDMMSSLSKLRMSGYGMQDPRFMSPG